MKWVVRIGAVLLVVAAALAAYGWHRLGTLDRPLSPSGGTVEVTIPSGTGFDAAVAALHEAGAVADPLVFRLYGRYTGAGGRIKAGTYTIDRSITPRILLDQLEKGPQAVEIRVTIPEGLNRWQMADLLSEKGLVDRDAFLKRVAADDLEGRLFPDTYRFRPDADLDAVVTTLRKRHDAVLAEVLAAAPADRRPVDGAARRTMLILASLIEKEGRTDRDRRLISRVFANRMKKGMKLQTDPTCVYDARWYREVPHPRYCKDPNNRYSTYVIDGLPPGPIANPGRAALAAALDPSDAPGAEKLLYFVARRDGSGEHHFSATYAEHRRAVNRYLKGPKRGKENR